MTAEDEFSLTERVAIVTGGSSGIGAASVRRRLAAAGARVVVGYNRGLDRAEKLIGELPGTGHCAMHLPLEDTAQIRRVAATVTDHCARPVYPRFAQTRGRRMGDRLLRSRTPDCGQ